MDALGVTRTVLLRAAARIGAALLLAAWLALALAGPGLAATESGPPTSSGNTTLIVAGVIGAAIAAVWLLKPSGRPRQPPASGSRNPGAGVEDAASAQPSADHAPPDR